MSKQLFAVVIFFLSLLFAVQAFAAMDGSLLGSVLDQQGVAVSGALVTVLNSDGNVIARRKTSLTGEYQIFPITLGDYEMRVRAPNFSLFSAVVHVHSGAPTQFDAHLTPGQKEIVVRVKARKQLLQTSNAVSSADIGKDQIAVLPEGDEVSLPKLISSTTPGAVSGPFGQTFFRGNHANIQYQIDGVQLPDSPSNTFGESFSPRNIDHMEVITGGIPAEYGERLAAVVNIVTKSGPEEPGGEVELNYGSYNTFSPHLLYGGSNESGSVHYYASANYFQTDRGLDTPEPASSGNNGVGGEDAIHDHATGNNEFAKIDWLLNNDDKLTLVFFNSENVFQIPNIPSSFSQSDPIFTESDQYGDSPLIWTPSNTNDVQTEANAYLETIWKHTFSDRSFLQLAPYYKYEYMHFQNDPANDLASGNSTAASFYENRNINNLGLKGDYTLRANAKHLFKAGFQYQYSNAQGMISVQTSLGSPPVPDANGDIGNFESVYAQDDWNFAKRWTLNVGLRFDATQFSFAGDNPTDSMLQPRIGVTYLVSDTTTVHAFYGKLFQPAPVENLRDEFVGTGQCNGLCPYDIKAEKDDYYEVGVAQQIFDSHVLSLNAYYKDATNMLDDQQLFNTVIAQPFNFAEGFAYGIEFSAKGDINARWSDYLNYSYEIAQGNGISGGAFSGATSTGWTFLDHVQLHTANAGVTYKREHYWWTLQGLFGSGLRVGPNNGSSLPAHVTFDTTFGYLFHGEHWYSKFKLSADVLNIMDDPYPITISNGFNGSHYAAGREYFIRLAKEF